MKRAGKQDTKYSAASRYDATRTRFKPIGAATYVYSAVESDSIHISFCPISSLVLRRMIAWMILTYSLEQDTVSTISSIDACFICTFVSDYHLPIWLQSWIVMLPSFKVNGAMRTIWTRNDVLLFSSPFHMIGVLMPSCCSFLWKGYRISSLATPPPPDTDWYLWDADVLWTSTSAFDCV